ncbi:hypothetical protein PARPLA_00846 [Rhodobacteraceae bacterium THAF1]|uniref:hypothetical protein n=1 Tax=Palleronia sp. THAF1 TaxID=2587842 RepID=UPI000F3CC8F3|nr:hypothetical protein [Palleronia sp. THAF1]QFU09595.1 hypothetical protein FIU81_13025 [Palleronia sp. THAF1]VDC17504.1 hypothetical protein PARPLA_00846 [Rhodobacteraceae bacterium THAF1]
MSVVTRFTELCAAFRLTDAQLRVAIQTDETTRSHAQLLRRNAALLDRIECFVPASVQELDEMIDFFARRRVDALHTFGPGLDRMSETLARYDRASLPNVLAGAMRFSRLPDPLPPTIESEDLARMVMRAPTRVAAIGPDKRYLAVSAAAAEAYRTTPSRMAGRHLLEVIGCGHYQGRERQKIELSFMGRPQDYVIQSESENGASLDTRVRMQVVEDRAGRPYATLRISDPIADKTGLRAVIDRPAQPDRAGDGRLRRS